MMRWSCEANRNQLCRPPPLGLRPAARGLRHSSADHRGLRRTGRAGAGIAGRTESMCNPMGEPSGSSTSTGWFPLRPARSRAPIHRTNFHGTNFHGSPPILSLPCVSIGRVKAGRVVKKGPSKATQSYSGKEMLWPQSQELVIGRAPGGGSRPRINGLPGWLVGLGGCSTLSTSPCFS